MPFSIPRLFNFEPGALSRKNLFYLMLITYVFGVVVRLFMLYYLLQSGSMWQANGAPVPIHSPDTGLYGYYAEQILSGHFYSIADPDKLPGYLIAVFPMLFAINIDWVIFLLPIFIAPLVVIPTLLIANTFKQPFIGIAAALFLNADLFYFSRTYLSYVDTDMLNLTLPLIITLFMMLVTLRGKLRYALFGAFTWWFYGLWYHSSASISAALLLGFLATTLLLFRNNRTNFQAFFIFATALVPLAPWVSLMAIISVFLLFALLNRHYNFGTKPYLVLFAIVMLATPFLNYSRYYERAEAYFERPKMITLHGKEQTYYFLNQLANVAEAVKLNPLEPAGYLNRQTSLMILATLGFILMLFRYPVMLFLSPLFVLGYASIFLGNRFMMYLAPETAFGMAFLLFVLFGAWKRYSTLRLPFNALRNLSVLFILIFMIDIINVNSKFYSNSFNANEVTALRSFNKQLSKEDTIITWWDYGWPLWFYTGYANTMADNGAHGSYDSYIISRILLSNSQEFSANAALYFSMIQKEAQSHGAPYALSYLAKKGVDLNTTLQSLHKSDGFKGKTEGNVYILLQGAMVDKLYSIDESSNFDFTTGKMYRPKVMQRDILEHVFNPDSPRLKGALYTLYSTNGTIEAGNKSYGIKALIESTDHKASFSRTYENDAPLSAFIARDRYVFYLNNSLFNSFFIQAYLFDHYDKSRFEKVVETKYMKIFKVLPPKH